jgi:uncharacterized protein (DUF305 family)
MTRIRDIIGFMLTIYHWLMKTSILVLGLVVLRGSAAVAQTNAADADVAFMQNMISHHAQALEMTALTATRSSRDDIKLLARRITESQSAETAMMENWLRKRGKPAADSSHVHPMDMPGMLTKAEIERLGQAANAEFDRLFLELMIRHHEGALTMVAALDAIPGAGEEPELWQLISHIDADQRAEIARMQRMLRTTPREK